MKLYFKKPKIPAKKAITVTSIIVILLFIITNFIIPNYQSDISENNIIKNNNENNLNLTNIVKSQKLSEWNISSCNDAEKELRQKIQNLICKITDSSRNMAFQIEFKPTDEFKYNTIYNGYYTI